MLCKKNQPQMEPAKVVGYILPVDEKGYHQKRRSVVAVLSLLSTHQAPGQRRQKNAPIDYRCSLIYTSLVTPPSFWQQNTVTVDIFASDSSSNTSVGLFSPCCLLIPLLKGVLTQLDHIPIGKNYPLMLIPYPNLTYLLIQVRQIIPQVGLVLMLSEEVVTVVMI